MSGLVVYPCPLGNGRFAQLYLPSDLTTGDVQRISAILRTLPLDAVEPVTLLNIPIEIRADIPTNAIGLEQGGKLVGGIIQIGCEDAATLEPAPVTPERSAREERTYRSHE